MDGNRSGLVIVFGLIGMQVLDVRLPDERSGGNTGVAG